MVTGFGGGSHVGCIVCNGRGGDAGLFEQATRLKFADPVIGSKTCLMHPVVTRITTVAVVATKFWSASIECSMPVW